MTVKKLPKTTFLSKKLPKIVSFSTKLPFGQICTQLLDKTDLKMKLIFKSHRFVPLDVNLIQSESNRTSLANWLVVGAICSDFKGNLSFCWGNLVGCLVLMVRLKHRVRLRGIDCDRQVAGYFSPTTTDLIVCNYGIISPISHTVNFTKLF